MNTTNQLVTGTRNENELIITLVGRINSNNAPEMEQKINELLQANPDCKLVLDFDQVEYISSAGLRVVLKNHKKNNDMSLINVSNEIWNIFDMTGFISFLHITKKMREVSIENCKLIGKGGNGNVYRLDPDTIIKVYTEKTPLCDIERERTYAQNAFLSGLSTAISYDVVRCEGSYGIVFELINADTVSSLILADPQKLDDYATIFANLVKQTHETHVKEGTLLNVKQIYNKWADEMSRWFEPFEVDKLHALINSIPDRDTIIH